MGNDCSDHPGLNIALVVSDYCGSHDELCSDYQILYVFADHVDVKRWEDVYFWHSSRGTVGEDNVLFDAWLEKLDNSDYVVYPLDDELYEQVNITLCLE